MSSIQFVMPSKGACKLPICSYVIVTMGGSAVLGLNYLLIAVVEIKPLASTTQRLSGPTDTQTARIHTAHRVTDSPHLTTFMTFHPKGPAVRDKYFPPKLKIKPILMLMVSFQPGVTW